MSRATVCCAVLGYMLQSSRTSRCDLSPGPGRGALLTAGLVSVSVMSYTRTAGMSPSHGFTPILCCKDARTDGIIPGMQSIIQHTSRAKGPSAYTVRSTMSLLHRHPCQACSSSIAALGRTHRGPPAAASHQTPQHWPGSTPRSEACAKERRRTGASATETRSGAQVWYTRRV